MDMKKYSGFSLIELMIALAVLSIIIAVGLPRMSVFFKGNRMVVNANDLIAGLNIARSEAIKRNGRVSICKSTNASDATPSCTTAGGWDQGWFVFVEGNEDGNIFGTYTPSDGAILRVNAGAEGANVTINADSPIANYVTFTSRGAPKLNNGASQSGVLRVCDERGISNARGVILNASGRVRTTKVATKIGACP